MVVSTGMGIRSTAVLTPVMPSPQPDRDPRGNRRDQHAQDYEVPEALTRIQVAAHEAPAPAGADDEPPEILQPHECAAANGVLDQIIARLSERGPRPLE